MHGVGSHVVGGYFACIERNFLSFTFHKTRTVRKGGGCLVSMEVFRWVDGGSVYMWFAGSRT